MITSNEVTTYYNTPLELNVLIDHKAVMQIYDRSNCTNTYQSCITHGCVNASYDVVTRSYVHPDRNPCIYQDQMKSVCRSLTHFEASSVWRLFQAVSSYASDILFPVTKYTNKEDSIVELLQAYMGCSLTSQDKEKVLHMYKFARSLGHTFFMRQNIEVGEYEREPFMFQPYENKESPFQDRRCLVDLAFSCLLPLDAAYGCEYTHALSNTTECVNACLLNKAYSTDDIKNSIYTSIMHFFLKSCNHNKRYFCRTITSDEMLFIPDKLITKQFRLKTTSQTSLYQVNTSPTSSISSNFTLSTFLFFAKRDNTDLPQCSTHNLFVFSMIVLFEDLI